MEQNLYLLLYLIRGAGAGPAGTAAAGPMLEAKLMNLIKGPVAEVLTQQ